MSVRIRTVALLAFWLGGATVARAQVPRGATADSVARGLGPADSLDLTLRPDCVGAERGHHDAGIRRGAATRPLCLTRQQAIAQALARNPQLQVAAEQVAQARARKVAGHGDP